MGQLLPCAVNHSTNIADKPCDQNIMLVTNVLNMFLKKKLKATETSSLVMGRNVVGGFTPETSHSDVWVFPLYFIQTQTLSVCKRRGRI